jgi:hypothetical protein
LKIYIVVDIIFSIMSNLLIAAADYAATSRLGPIHTYALRPLIIGAYSRLSMNCDWANTVFNAVARPVGEFICEKIPPIRGAINLTKQAVGAITEKCAKVFTNQATAADAGLFASSLTGAAAASYLGSKIPHAIASQFHKMDEKNHVPGWFTLFIMSILILFGIQKKNELATAAASAAPAQSKQKDPGKAKAANSSSPTRNLLPCLRRFTGKPQKA